VATQIAPTPAVKGEAAEIIYEEMRRKPTQAARKGAQILLTEFSKMIQNT